MEAAVLDSPITEFEAPFNVDYFTNGWEYEDIWVTRKYICNNKDRLEGFIRLENALWRTWAKKLDNLPCFSTQTLGWYDYLGEILIF